MPAAATHKIVTTLGFISVLHAAYSAAQHRSYLRITEQEFTTLPVDILIQGILSLFVVMYGVLYIAGDFKEIRAVVDLENKSWESTRNVPSFQIFHHRGRCLSPDYVSRSEQNPRKLPIERQKNYHKNNPSRSSKSS